MKLRGDWMRSAGAQALFCVFEEADHDIYFVGGCVRNDLMGEPVTDMDLASSARPEVMVALGEAAGLKVVPTGVAHGTVTFVMDGVPFEVTTFRSDVETDGRHAIVRFSDSIEEDAARRDFTINALYANGQGDVLDPLGGFEDVQSRRVRFIGDASERIKEDYLRSLRFFRFVAQYGDAEHGIDADALSAIAGNLEGLGGLSKERVTSELVKLLGASEPVVAIAAMRQSGVLSSILPGAEDRALGPLVHVETLLGLEPDAMRRLAALGGRALADGLRLSKVQTRALEVYRSEAEGSKSAAHLGFALGQSGGLGVLALRAALLEAPLELGAAEAVEAGAAAVCPVRAQDFTPGLKGQALGEALQLARLRWIESGFTLGRDELLP